ncbi:hypothetical protein IH992_04755 [Candidatus Poribacteria bacterium]|nr:hypothetical protein [Candidatus Poribacteria bacterium]
MKESQKKLKAIASQSFALLSLIALFCCILIPPALSVKDDSATYPSSTSSSSNLGIVVLIDNSRDIFTLDPQGMRWQATKLLIDRLQTGDQLGVIDLNSQSLIPMTQLTGNIDQKETLKGQVGVAQSGSSGKNMPAALSKAADELLKIPNHVSKKAIILLTNGGIDAMSLKPSNLFNSAVSHIAVYTVDTTETAGVPLFHIPSNLDPVLSCLQIVNALQAHSSLAGRSTWVDVEKKQAIFIHHPRTDEVEFQFTFEKGRNVKIILQDPKRQEIAPYAQGDTYQLYRVNAPKLGFWQAIIQGEESSRASQVHQIVVERKSSEMTSRKSGGLDIPVTELNFKPLKKSHGINEPITLEIKASPRANPLNLPYLDVLVISPIGREMLKLKRQASAKKLIYQTQYSRTPFAGEYAFVVVPDQNYVVSPPFRTIHVLTSPGYRFPLMGILGVSGGVAFSAFLFWHFMRIRSKSHAKPSGSPSLAEKVKRTPFHTEEPKIESKETGPEVSAAEIDTESEEVEAEEIFVDSPDADLNFEEIIDLDDSEPEEDALAKIATEATDDDFELGFSEAEEEEDFSELDAALEAAAAGMPLDDFNVDLEKGDELLDELNLPDADLDTSDSSDDVDIELEEMPAELLPEVDVDANVVPADYESAGTTVNDELSEDSDLLDVTDSSDDENVESDEDILPQPKDDIEEPETIVEDNNTDAATDDNELSEDLDLLDVTDSSDDENVESDEDMFPKPEAAVDDNNTDVEDNNEPLEDLDLLDVTGSSDDENVESDEDMFPKLETAIDDNNTDAVIKDANELLAELNQMSMDSATEDVDESSAALDFLRSVGENVESDADTGLDSELADLLKAVETPSRARKRTPRQTQEDRTVLDSQLADLLKVAETPPSMRQKTSPQTQAKTDQAPMDSDVLTVLNQINHIKEQME